MKNIDSAEGMNEMHWIAGEREGQDDQVSIIEQTDGNTCS